MVLNPIVNEGIRRVSSENNLPRLTAHVIPFFGLNDDSLILEFRKSGCFHGGLLFDLGFVGFLRYSSNLNEASYG
jgi:hypothetical protein